jgi:hypothetical protein
VKVKTYGAPSLRPDRLAVEAATSTVKVVACRSGLDASGEKINVFVPDQ